MIVPIALVLALIAAPVGKAASAEDRAKAASAPAPSPEPAELERLRALGYVDYADEIVEPDASVVPVRDPLRSAPGLNLFVTWRMSRAELVDAAGRVRKSWSHAPSEIWSNAELTPGGDLLVSGHDGQPYLLRLAWDGTVVWKRRHGTHHDVELLPDGRIATLVERRRRLPQVDAERVVLDHAVALLNGEDGEIVREHSLYDMLSAAPQVFRFRPVAPDLNPGKGVLDLFHANSVEFMHRPELEARSAIFAAGNAIVSVRHQDTVAIFDLDAGRVVWAWGQGELSGPHDASVLENGNVLIFDNGIARKWSRVVELDPLERKIVWEYRAPVPTDFYTKGRGSSQRLPNGNTLSVNSNRGRPSRSRGRARWCGASRTRTGARAGGGRRWSG